MSRKQVYALIGMGLLMIVILASTVIAIDFSKQLEQNHLIVAATLDELQRQTDAKNNAITGGR